jgi:deoxyribonuclease V
VAALTWPGDVDGLMALQRELAARTPAGWQPPSGTSSIAGCWVCFPRGYSGPGSAGDPAWAAAAVVREGRLVDRRAATGMARAPYAPGLLALRVGPLLDAVVRALRANPDLLLVDGTGRDHPRRAGLALHIGAELDLPTVGVTHRPLLARGSWPEDRRGATSPLRMAGEVVGCWLRVQPGLRPLAVHPGWRMDLATAVDVVLDATPRHRTPEPLRLARHAARAARNAGWTMGS